LDPESEDDLLVDLKEGDAIVLPAGVAHCSMNLFPTLVPFLVLSVVMYVKYWLTDHVRFRK
jgi:uncharacterized protein YjlB